MFFGCCLSGVYHGGFDARNDSGTSLVVDRDGDVRRVLGGGRPLAAALGGSAGSWGFVVVNNVSMTDDLLIERPL